MSGPTMPNPEASNLPTPGPMKSGPSKSDPSKSVLAKSVLALRRWALRLCSRQGMRQARPALALLGLGVLVAWWGFGGAGSADTSSAISYDWQWRRALRQVLVWREGHLTLGPLLEGLGVTLRIVGASLGLAMLLGLGAAILRDVPSRVGQAVAGAYVGLVRNTPLLIQLFAIYFVLAPLMDISAFWSAVWALSAFEGAYMAEVFRAGIGDVPRGQWDAARSLGMSTPRAFVLVIGPQALRRILPPLTSQTVSLIKDSALVSAIALPDLTMRTQAAIADTFLSLELWALAAGIYLLLTLAVSVPARWVEGHYAWRWI